MIWDSPFGPLRFDYSFPLSKEPYDRVQQFRFGGGTKLIPGPLGLVERYDGTVFFDRGRGLTVGEIAALTGAAATRR